MTPTQKIFDSVALVSEELLEENSFPLLLSPPNFDFEKLSRDVQKSFGLSAFFIKPISEQKWREEREIVESIGGDYLFLSFHFSPIEGPIFWVMSKDDVAKLTSKLTAPSGNQKLHFYPAMQEGLYRFFAMHILAELQKQPPFSTLSLKIGDNFSIKEHIALCSDFSIHIEQTTCFGRLCIPSSFRRNWNQYIQKNMPEYKKENLLFSLPISLQIGGVILSVKQWESVNVGDFILLDEIKYEIEKKKGSVDLCLGSTPIFYAKIKHNRIKVVYYAEYTKEKSCMDDEDFYIEEEELEDPKNQLFSSPALDEEPLGHSAKEEEPQTFEKESPEATSISDLPLNVRVEVGRIRITVEKLRQIQPGNLLEIPVNPQEGVTLTVNGKKIAKAELIRLGEKVGVRILELC